MGITNIIVKVKIAIVTNFRVLENDVRIHMNCLLPAFFEIRTNLCRLVYAHDRLCDLVV
jgi:hypothetical protein